MKRLTLQRVIWVVLICVAVTIVFASVVAPVEAQSTTTKRFEAMFYDGPLTLTSCKQSPASLCVVSFGSADQSLLVALKSPNAFPYDLALSMNGHLFQCKISVLAATRMNCTGALFQDGDMVLIDISANNRLVASGAMPVQLSSPFTPRGEIEESSPDLYVFLPIVSNGIAPQDVYQYLIDLWNSLSNPH